MICRIADPGPRLRNTCFQGTFPVLTKFQQSEELEGGKTGLESVLRAQENGCFRYLCQLSKASLAMGRGQH